MKVGISLGALNPSLWVKATEVADQLGYESVWLPEHLVIPVQASGSPIHGADHPPVPSNVPVFDVFVYIAHLAGRTEKIRFGTQVFNVGLRHPFITGRAVATADVLSGGRVEFGIGSSWLKEEWDAVGLDFATRGRRVDEALDVLRRLWTEETVEHHGEFFDFGPTMFEPKPVQAGGPPIVVGGDAQVTLRRAARLGSGWIPMNHSLEQLPASIKRLAELCEEAGRTDKVELTLALPVESADDLQRYAEIGIDRVLVRPWRRTSDALDGLARFADELMPVAATISA